MLLQMEERHHVSHMKAEKFCDEIPELCEPYMTVFKMTLNCSSVEQGKETDFAKMIIDKIEKVIEEEGKVKPKFDKGESKNNSLAAMLSSLIRSNGASARQVGLWGIAGPRWALEVTCRSRGAAKKDAKEHPEGAEKMVVKEGLGVRYKSKIQWIAAEVNPPTSNSYQLYSQFKDDDFEDVAKIVDFEKDKNTISTWAEVVPKLGEAGNGSMETSAHCLKILQEEVVLLDGKFTDKKGVKSKFEPAVIFWFDMNDPPPRKAFTGELTWELKHDKYKQKEIDSSRKKLFNPLTFLLDEAGLLDAGAKTAKAYARMDFCKESCDWHAS